jgi:hypothetical protein
VTLKSTADKIQAQRSEGNFLLHTCPVCAPGGISKGFERDSAITATRLADGSLISDRKREFSASHRVQTGSKDHPMGAGGNEAGDKFPAGEETFLFPTAPRPAPRTTQTPMQSGCEVVGVLLPAGEHIVTFTG